MTCLHCEGWTCARCASPHDVAAAGGGEQSLTSTELETTTLRNEVIRLRGELLTARANCLHLVDQLTRIHAARECACVADYADGACAARRLELLSSGRSKAAEALGAALGAFV